MSRDMIAALDMADELGEDPDQGDENDENRKPKRIPASARRLPEGEEQESSQQAMEEMAGRRRRIRIRRNGSPVRWTSTSSRRRATEEDTEGEEPWRPQLPFSSNSNEDFYKVFTNQFDEVMAPRTSATPRN
jgi:cobaltochelatase CobT